MDLENPDAFAGDNHADDAVARHRTTRLELHRQIVLDATNGNAAPRPARPWARRRRGTPGSAARSRLNQPSCPPSRPEPARAAVGGLLFLFDRLGNDGAGARSAIVSSLRADGRQHGVERTSGRGVAALS